MRFVVSEINNNRWICTVVNINEGDVRQDEEQTVRRLIEQRINNATHTTDAKVSEIYFVGTE